MLLLEPSAHHLLSWGKRTRQCALTPRLLEPQPDFLTIWVKTFWLPGYSWACEKMSLSCCHDGHFITMIYKWIVSENGCSFNHTPAGLFSLACFKDKSSYPGISQQLAEALPQMISVLQKELTFSSMNLKICILPTPSVLFQIPSLGESNSPELFIPFSSNSVSRRK